MKASEVMYSPAITVTSDIPITEAADKMLRYGIGHLPVRASKTNQDMIGLLSESDILPLLPSRNLPPEEYDEKREEASRILVSEKMHENVVHVYLNSSIEEVVEKLCYPTIKRGYINLVPVTTSKKAKTIEGVISWVNILKNWGKYASDANDTMAKDIGTELAQLPILKQGSATIAYTLHLFDNMEHRHLPLRDENNNIIALFSDRDIRSFTPLLNNPTEAERYFNKQINSDDVKPQYENLDEIVISSTMPLYNDASDDNIIKYFLKFIEGKNIPWSERLDGLLVRNDESKIVRLITPFDCMKLLVKKK